MRAFARGLGYRRRWVMLFLRALALCGLAAGAPAHAFSLCQQGPRMTEDELFHVRADMVAYAAVRDAETVSKIEIREVSTDAIGPYSEVLPSGGHVIVVPEGFRRMQCQLVLIQMLLYRQRDDAVLWQLKTIYDTCMRAEQEMAICLQRSVDKVAAVWASSFDKLLDAEERASAPGIIQTAFRSLIFHEVGHIVLGHDSGAEGRKAAVQELDADQYAIVHSMLALGAPAGTFSTFAVLSVIDDQIDWSHEPHQSFVCRARNAEQVIHRFTDPVRLLMTLTAGGADDYRRIRADIDQPSTVELLTPRERKALAAHPCAAASTASTARIEALARDLRLLIDAIDRLGGAIPALSDGPGTRNFITYLRAVRLVTPEGRSIRETILSTRLFLIIGDDNADRSEHERLAAETLAMGQPQDTLSADYGRYFGVRSSAVFINAPAGSEAAAVVAETRGLSAKAVFYNPNLSSAWFTLSQTEFMSGNCEAGVIAGRRTLLTANEPEKQREFIEMVEGAYRNSGCAAVQKILVDGQKHRAGWR